MAAALQFPFTTAQWKELERQAMIYKYMMASLPVPTHLLFPLTTTFSPDFTTTTTTTSRGVDLYGWGYSSLAPNSKDAEPGRCKRTDGKKWRCSRDVAPNQKYCERHMHRGRPRSRKHVEVQPLVSQNNNNKKTRLNNTTIKKSDIVQPNSQQIVQTSGQSNGTSHVLPKMNTDLSIKPFDDRGVNLMMENKMMGIEVIGKQWSNFVNHKFDNHPSLFQKQYEGEGMNMFCYTDSTAVRDVSLTVDECQFYINSDKQSKLGFIDAWSNDGIIRTTNSNNNGSSLSSPRGDISPSSLTLSMAMAAGNVINEEMEKIQEGNCCYRNRDTSFLSSHSWIPFASGGGPLAEALHTSGVAETPSNPASHGSGNDDSISPL